MKKYLVAAIVLLIVLALAPLAVGKMVEARIDRGLNQVVLQAPFLRIAERKYHSGWFTSRMDVTFELFSGVGGESLAPRFTVHGDILHGPILGAGIGMARVRTHFELPDSARKEMEKFFGTEEPFSITTTVGFSGGAATVVTSEAHQYSSANETLAWDPLKLVIASSGNGESFTIDGKWPRFEGNSADGSKIALRGMRVTGAGKRLVGELFDTDLDFGIDELQVAEPNETIKVADLHYIAATEPHGDLLDMSTKLGAGAIKTGQIDLKEAHYDFTMRRLHIATFDKLMTEFKTAYTRPEKSPVSLEHGIPEPYKGYGLELLKHDPELSIDRLGFVTGEGAGYITGTIKLKGVVPQDLDAGSLGLINRIVADINVDVSEAMLAKLSGSTDAADGVVKQGLAERKDGHLLSKILFQDGKLSINGKVQPLPGFGGSAPPPPTSRE